MSVDRVRGLGVVSSNVTEPEDAPAHKDAQPTRTPLLPLWISPLGSMLSVEAFSNPHLTMKPHNREKADHEVKAIEVPKHADVKRPTSRERVYTTNPAEMPVRTTHLDPARDVYPAIGKLCPTLSREAKLMLAAQFSHETGGGASCFNFNLGNVKAAPGLKEPHMFLANNKERVSPRELARLTDPSTPFHECVHLVKTETDKQGHERHTVVLDPPHPSSAFRAYATADEGIAAWVHRFERYMAKSPELVEAMNNGDSHAFATILQTRFAYYTDDAKRYGDAVERRAREIAPKVPHA